MGGRAGGGAGMGSRSRGGYSSARARELAGKYLGDVKNPALKKELADGLAAFEKEFGLPENLSITMATLSKESRYGQIQLSTNRVELNKKLEDGRMSLSLAKHAITHELAHSLDRTYKTEISRDGKMTVKAEHKSFEKQLLNEYKSFKFNHGRGHADAKSIGQYALKNKHEFFADAIAKHFTGTTNRYTTFAYNLAKSMKK